MVQNASLIEKKSLFFSIRFLLAIIGCFIYATQYSQNIGLSLGVVCMINHTAVDSFIQNNSSLTATNVKFSNPKCSPNETNLNSSNLLHSKSSDGPFIWNKEIVGIILSAYFVGYALTQILGAWLSFKFGARIVLGISVMSFSILTMCIPLASFISFKAVVFIRFLIGVLQGPIWPTFSGFWAKWAPPSEISTLVSVANSGSQFGTFMTFFFGGFLCEYGFGGGWPSIFYILGLIGVVISVLWLVFSSSTPGENFFIKQTEIDYIERETKNVVGSDDLQSNRKIPWFKILTDSHVLALFVGHISSDWGVFLFLTCLPMYMKEVLQFDISSNGLLSALPYIVFWVFQNVSAVFADSVLKNRFKFETISIRRIFNTVGFFVPMLAMAGLMFITCEFKFLGVAFITVGFAFIGCQYAAGYLIGFNDISGSFSGIVYSIANTTSSIVGFLAPYCVSILTPNKTQKEWQQVFLITAVIYLVGGIATVLFATDNKTKSWALETTEKKAEEMPLKEQ